MFGLALACGGDDNDDQSSVTGNLGEECISGSVCQGNLVCVGGVCMMSGDGDTTGDGDGDPTTGDGDGEPTTGDGDGEPTTGDGDGSPDLKGLYEGPCLNSADCEGDLWCAVANGRYWCTTGCADANDTSCPAHPSASAMPVCRSVTDNDPQGGNKWSCTLLCTDPNECPTGAQCFGSGIGSQTWCGFL